jgi:fructose-1,6-bisphosphatase/inositol monophosphatase family enzyme
VIPWEGLLLGWRNTVPRLFHLPESPRSQCFALDAVMVAEGTLDASIIVFGGIWDFAATSLIVRESGGETNECFLKNFWFHSLLSLS